MTSAAYISGRKKYSRPQAMLWADNPGVATESGLYVPAGYEIGANTESVTDESLLNQFIILSDNNRLPIDISFERIEQRERMINGRMRSYHIADKLRISTSWENLPSRAFTSSPNFDELGKPSYAITEIDHDDNPLTALRKVQPSGSPYYRDQQYTTDGGAGGVEILDWYNNHPGSFWLYLAYDNYKNFNSNEYSQLGQYNEVVEVFFADFQYSVSSRGANNYDLWDISIQLEEV